MSRQLVSPANFVAFEDRAIRRTWHNEEWWFSVVDVVAALTESRDAGAYWRKLKQRLKEEGSEVVTFCHELKLLAPDGKLRETDGANTQTKSVMPAKAGIHDLTSFIIQGLGKK